MKKLIIIGGGFAGIELANRLLNTDLRITLIDKNNYHCFQPLLYQVATAGLEPDTIAFPLRKIFSSNHNIAIRRDEILSIHIDKKEIHSSTEIYTYDYLIVATGAISNFFGNKLIAQNAIGLKSMVDALNIRSLILENLEEALITEDQEKWQKLMNICIVGGGPTGVEMAGAIAEMKKHIFPKDFPELDFSKMSITLIESSEHLLNSMSDKSKAKSKHYLEHLGVHVLLNTRVVNYDDEKATLNNSIQIPCALLIWAAGIKATAPAGIETYITKHNQRIQVNEYNQVIGLESSCIFAIGDACIMTNESNYPNGHPQVAPVAIQMAKNLAKNIKALQNNKPLVPFKYKNNGSMATVGRNLAVVDTPWMNIQGFIAWIIWMFIHLILILGVRNRLFIFINWLISYFTYDKGLRLIIRSYKSK